MPRIFRKILRKNNIVFLLILRSNVALKISMNETLIRRNYLKVYIIYSKVLIKDNIPKPSSYPRLGNQTIFRPDAKLNMSRCSVAFPRRENEFAGILNRVAEQPHYSFDGSTTREFSWKLFRSFFLFV